MVISLWFFGLVMVIKITKSNGGMTTFLNTVNYSASQTDDNELTTITTPLVMTSSTISLSYYTSTEQSSVRTEEVTTKGNNFLDSLNSFADKCHGLFLIFFSICLILYICSKTIKPMKRLVTRIKVRRKRKKETKYQKWLAVYSRKTGEVNCTPGSSLKTL